MHSAVAIPRRLPRLLRRTPEDDPLARLRAAREEQLRHLDAALRSVADLAAQRRRAELLAQQAAAEQAEAQRAAREAVAAGRDSAARGHLRRALAAESRLRDLEARHDAVGRHLRDLTARLGDLRARVRAEGLREEQLLAHHDAARAVLGAQEALRASSRTAAAAGRAAEEARRQAREAETRALGYAELAGTQSAQAAFDDAEVDQAVEDGRRWLGERPLP